jgi:hypothetical protein
MSPEGLLWLDVILRALQDAAGLNRDLDSHGAARGRCTREALDWFFSSDHDVGSFLFCCEALDFDPGAIRRGLTPSNIRILNQKLNVRLNYVRPRHFDALDTFDCSDGRRVTPAVTSFRAQSF